MINHIQSEFVATTLHRHFLEEFERLQQRGGLWLHDEVVQYYKMATIERAGFQDRVLLSIGDFLISCGLWLKGRGGATSPAAVR